MALTTMKNRQTKEIEPLPIVKPVKARGRPRKVIKPPIVAKKLTKVSPTAKSESKYKIQPPSPKRKALRSSSRITSKTSSVESLADDKIEMEFKSNKSKKVTNKLQQITEEASPPVEPVGNSEEIHTKLEEFENQDKSERYELTKKQNEKPEDIPDEKVQTEKHESRKITVIKSPIKNSPKRLEQCSMKTDDNSEESEDEDPYDLCQMTTITESDDINYKCYTYTGRDNYCPDVKRDENVSASVMYVYLDGEPHKLVVTNELELFSEQPKSPSQLKNKFKTIDKTAKEKKNDKKKEKVIKKVNKVNSKSSDEFDSENSSSAFLTSTPFQPKIKIKHWNRNAGKGNVINNKNSNRSDSCEKDQTESKKVPSPRTPSLSNREITPKTTPTLSGESTEANSTNIRIEDIDAILSHLHGK